VLQQPLEQIGDSLRAQVEGLRRFEPDWNGVLLDLLEVAVIRLMFLAYHLTRFIINRVISREVDEDDPIVKRLRQQRVQTVAALARHVIQVVFVIVAVLTVLGTVWDIEIGPILASVGVLGLAVSFGAQSLVKDIITGTFMLLEGQFGIGDVISVGDASGAVEKITLRTTVLRDLNGAVHIIPNGEITRVTNLTKAWSRAVLDIGVAYREDVDRVIAVLEDEGERFHQDPQWRELLLDPPEVLGVESFADSAMVIRMLARTLPEKQWNVGRELRRRIKIRFHAEGIEIPFPHVILHWDERAGDLAPESSRPEAARPEPRALAERAHQPNAVTRTES
jgi:small conductance mechanosensitive channel